MMDAQASWLSEQMGGRAVPSPEVRPPDHSPADAETLQIGATQAQVLYTPGHTEGSLCLYVPQEDLLLAGDTLFAGSVGRTDLPGGDYRRLLRSIHTRLLPLPDATVVISGHGPETTIGEERETNPFLA